MPWLKKEWQNIKDYFNLVDTGYNLPPITITVALISGILYCLFQVALKR